MVRQGRLNTLVERTYPLAEAAEALRVIEDRDVFGKIVVTP
jgi:alcohol dehydrogenase